MGEWGGWGVSGGVGRVGGKWGSGEGEHLHILYVCLLEEGHVREGLGLGLGLGLDYISNIFTYCMFVYLKKATSGKG